MFYGYNTKGAVALKLMERWGSRAPWFIHHILLDRKTWRDTYSCTNYVWWRFVIDEDGLNFEIEGEGKEFRRGNTDYPEIEIDTLYHQGTVDWKESHRTHLDAMLHLGLQPFQWVLSTWRMSVSGGGYYDDDWDSSVESEIVFVEPMGGLDDLWLPLRDPYIVDKPVLYGIRVQEPVVEEIKEAVAA